jgi:hypothetical protein
MDLLKCHLKWQVFTLSFLGNLIQPVLRHHDSVPQPECGPWGIHIQASPIVDLAIVVCDTYW